MQILVAMLRGAVHQQQRAAAYAARCHLYSRLLRLLWFWLEEQNSELPKTFFGGYLLVFVEYLCNRSSKL